MGGAKALTGLAVEVFVEEVEVLPQGVPVERGVAAQGWDGFVLVAAVEVDQALGDQGGDLPQVVLLPPRQGT